MHGVSAPRAVVPDTAVTSSENLSEGSCDSDGRTARRPRE